MGLSADPTAYTYSQDPSTGANIATATFPAGPPATNLTTLTQIKTVTVGVGDLDGTNPVTAYTATLSSYEIGSDGVIRGTYDDGIKRDMGRVELATFTNRRV